MSIFDKLRDSGNKVATDKKTNYKTRFMGRFEIDRELWDKFKAKHSNASIKLREFIERDLKGYNGKEQIQRDKIDTLLSVVNSEPCLQITGQTGCGKSTMVKKLIEKDTAHIYIIVDSHSEYTGKEITSISKDVKHNCVLRLPKSSAGSKGVFSVYAQQILSEKLPESFIIVVEEAHRYKEIKELLKESRKFVKVLAITPEKLTDSCKCVEVVK
jgi:ABC-type glutathione transport system ATPase component